MQLCRKLKEPAAGEGDRSGGACPKDKREQGYNKFMGKQSAGAGNVQSYSACGLFRRDGGLSYRAGLTKSEILKYNI